MSGYPAAVVLADAALKNLTSPTLAAAALARMKTTADKENKPAARREVIPYSEPISVSRALESAVADACIGRLARRLGAHDDAEAFAERAQLYRKYYDPVSQLLLPRDPTGRAFPLHGNRLDASSTSPSMAFHGLPPTARGFPLGRPLALHWPCTDLPRPLPLTVRALPRPFHALTGSRFDDTTRRFFEEGTPLQYLFMVPHDAPGLASLLGGPASLAARLDAYFTSPVELAAAGAQQDLETGNLGGHCQV